MSEITLINKIVINQLQNDKYNCDIDYNNYLHQLDNKSLNTQVLLDLDTLFETTYSKIETNYNKIEDIINDIENWIIESGRKPIVVIDYLQLIKSKSMSSNQSTKQLIDFILAELNYLALKHNIVIFLISALNRANYDNITLSSFKESGDIDYICNTAMILQRNSINDAYTRLTLHFVKNRYGELNDCKLNYYGNKCYFDI